MVEPAVIDEHYGGMVKIVIDSQKWKLKTASFLYNN